MNKEFLQEEEYSFPYHHLVDIAPFTETHHLFWGYKYAAYLSFILDWIGSENPKSFIDIGCGDGKLLHEASRRFPSMHMVGVDYSSKSLQFARAFTPHIQFFEHSAERFDSFALIEVIEHINPETMDSFLDRVCANLNKGAIGMITTPSTNVPVNPKHYQHFDAHSIQSALQTHFKVRHIGYLNAETAVSAVLRRLLANRLFILNYQPLMSWVFDLYKRRYLRASERDGSQIYAIVQKK